MEDRPRQYPSDTSDEQWAVIEPLLSAVKTGGRPEKHSRRAIVDGVLYVVRTGCAWRQLPAGFPPWQTVYLYFHPLGTGQGDREDSGDGACRNCDCRRAVTPSPAPG
jgi:transposase